MTTNFHTALRLADLRPCANPNGNMHVEVTSGRLQTTEDFTVMGYGYSYRTIVAAVAINHKTKKRELWMTPDGYSPTTMQHKTHFRRAFRQENPDCEIYHTFAVNALNSGWSSTNHATLSVIGGITRNTHHGDYDYTMGFCKSRLDYAAQPRIRHTTRQQCLRDAASRITATLHNLTNDTTPRNMEHIVQLGEIFQTINAFLSVEGERKLQTALIRGYNELESL